MNLAQRIKKYLERNNGWLQKDEIARKAQSAGFSSEYANRTCRMLAEEGEIEVQYRKGKRGQQLAFYRAKERKIINYKVAKINGEIIKKIPVYE